VHSAFEVGFESAKMIGRWLSAAIRAMISRVNVRGWPEAPMSTVGFTASSAASSVGWYSASCA